MDERPENRTGGKRASAAHDRGGRPRTGDCARSSARGTERGDGGLFRQMRREARLRPQCARRPMPSTWPSSKPSSPMYNDLMLAPSGLTQARTRDDRGRGVVAEPLLLLPGRARRRGARAFRRSGARRADRDELPRRRGSIQRQRGHARFRGQADDRALDGRGRGSRQRCAPPASPIATSGTSPPSPAFFNMSTGSRRRPTCGRTRTITGRRGSVAMPKRTPSTASPRPGLA